MRFIFYLSIVFPKYILYFFNETLYFLDSRIPSTVYIHANNVVFILEISASHLVSISIPLRTKFLRVNFPINSPTPVKSQTPSKRLQSVSKEPCVVKYWIFRYIFLTYYCLQDIAYNITVWYSTVMSQFILVPS